MNEIAERTTGSPESLLDRVVGAYELALRLGEADLESYLPAPTSPAYADVLVELIRVDLEWQGRQGRPPDLDGYRVRFPEAFRSPQHRAALEAEAARQRRIHEAAPGDAGDPIPTPADILATRVVEALRDRQERPATPEALSSRPAFPGPGDDFLEFHLVSELGRGAFGRVFLAHQHGLAERPVALKIAVDLRQESHALAQLQHTNIVPIYSVHRAGGLQAVCMPYFGRTTLADVYRDLLLHKQFPSSGHALVSTLRDRLRLPTASVSPAEPLPEPPLADSPLRHLAGLSYVEAVLWLVARLADGLGHAHSRGILHRDLKPANVLITDAGEPMLLDFNLAADQKEDATLATAGGTLPYMSPEQLEAFARPPEAEPGPPLTPASDLYALGIILFELLTGKAPFPSFKGLSVAEKCRWMAADRRAGAPSPRQVNPAVSPAVDAIVRRCLDPDPARRYQSARELREDLQAQLDHRPLKHTPEPSLAERLSKFRRRHPRLLSLTTCGLVVLCLGTLLSLALYWRGEQVADLKAREAARGLREDRRELEFLLTARSAPALVPQALDRAQAALARFPDDGRLQRLPDEERTQARADTRDVLWLSALAHLLRVDPGRPEVAAGDLDRADELLAEALRRGGADEVPQGLRLLQARVARLRGRTAEAEALEEGVRTGQPETAADWYRLAFAQAEQGRYRQALDAVGEALDRDPTLFNGWFLRGLCCDHLGRDGESATCYTVCIALKPTVAEAYFNRGLARARQRQPDAARKDFSEAIRLKPEDALAYLNRALTLYATGDFAAAEADATRALDLGGDPARLHLVRSRIREKRGNADGASHDRTAGLAAQPGDVDGWLMRGLARLPREPEAALADFEAALRLDPRSVAALQNQAHVLSKYLQKPAESLRALDAAVALCPEDPRPWAGRGVLRARLGQDAAALADAEAALALDTQPANHYQVAGIYALASRRDPAHRDTAFRLLTAALKAGFGHDLLAGDRDLDPIREDPRFRRVLALAGIGN